MSTSRAAFLSRGALTVAGLTLGGAATAHVTRAAAGPADDDLAAVRLLIASELLAIDFYTNALATKQYDGTPTGPTLRHALGSEQAHYDALARVLTDAGEAPAVASEIDFAYPKGAYGSRGSIARLGRELEAVAVGAALGATTAVQAPELRLLVTRIVASEAQHLSVFSSLTGGSAVGPALPGALSPDAATAALSDFES